MQKQYNYKSFMENLSMRISELSTKVIQLENRIRYQEKKSDEILLGQCFNLVAANTNILGQEYGPRVKAVFNKLKTLRKEVLR